MVFMRALDFIKAYHKDNQGKAPPWIEFDEAEYEQLREEWSAMFLHIPAGFLPTEFCGIPIRVVKDA